MKIYHKATKPDGFDFYTGTVDYAGALAAGRPVAQQGHKFGFRSLRVLREIPAHLALGPNGEATAALIDRASRLTPQEASRLGATPGAARDATRAAARDATRGGAWGGDRPGAPRPHLRRALPGAPRPVVLRHQCDGGGLVTPLTLAELRYAQASLALRAEKLRDRWRTAPSTGPTALSLGKQVKIVQARADEYAALIRIAEGAQP